MTIRIRISQLFFWFAMCLALGGSAVLDIIVAPTLFHTNDSFSVQIPHLPAGVDPAKYLGGQTFGDILMAYSVLYYPCVVILIGVILLESFLYLKNSRHLAFIRLALLVPLIGATIFFAIAAVNIRNDYAVWVARVGQGETAQATDARKDLDWWHHAATGIDMVKLLSLAAIAVATAWSLPFKSERNN